MSIPREWKVEPTSEMFLGWQSWGESRWCCGEHQTIWLVNIHLRVLFGFWGRLLWYWSFWHTSQRRMPRWFLDCPCSWMSSMGSMQVTRVGIQKLGLIPFLWDGTTSLLPEKWLDTCRWSMFPTCVHPRKTQKVHLENRYTNSTAPLFHKLPPLRWYLDWIHPWCSEAWFLRWLCDRKT